MTDIRDHDFELGEMPNALLLHLGEGMETGRVDGDKIAKGTPGGHDAIDLFPLQNFPKVFIHLILHQCEA